MKAISPVSLAVIFVACWASVAIAQPAPDDAELARKVKVLELIWRDAESKPIGSTERQTIVKEFLSSSEFIRELPAENRAAGGVWMLRGIASLELNYLPEAKEAGLMMQKLGIDKSPDENCRELLAQFDRIRLLDENTDAAAMERDARCQDLVSLLSASKTRWTYMETEISSRYSEVTTKRGSLTFVESRTLALSTGDKTSVYRYQVPVGALDPETLKVSNVDTCYHVMANARDNQKCINEWNETNQLNPKYEGMGYKFVVAFPTQETADQFKAIVLRVIAIDRLVR